MSLEALLAENTEAVKALTAAILAQAAAPQSSGAAHETPQADLAEPAAPKPARGKARAAAANAPTVPTATEAQAAAPASKPSAPPSPQPTSAQTPDTPAANAPDYETAARAVTALAKACGREAAVAVLAQFGAARLPEVAPEQFAAVIAACGQAQEAAGAQA
jgi:hypothetical protein